MKSMFAIQCKNTLTDRFECCEYSDEYGQTIVKVFLDKETAIQELELWRDNDFNKTKFRVINIKAKEL